jgi:23S rRNA-/tRNA-specific pseudouridylate synthase
MCSQVTVDGTVLSCHKPYKIRAGAKIEWEEHLHEPPIFFGSLSIPILFENEEIIVLSKPASVPCYPTGPYDCNSLSEILKRENVHGEHFRPVHRLDRLNVVMCYSLLYRVMFDRFEWFVCPLFC